VNFDVTTLCVASQRVFIVFVSVYFVIDSVRKLLVTTSYKLAELFVSFSSVVSYVEGISSLEGGALYREYCTHLQM
jgi:hypothetical protein